MSNDESPAVHRFKSVDVAIKVSSSVLHTGGSVCAIHAKLFTAMHVNIPYKTTLTTEFYIHGSVHRESNLIIFQHDATYSVYYISAGSSTYFGY